jgi:hypothetical protein
MCNCTNYTTSALLEYASGCDRAWTAVREEVIVAV